MTARGGMTWPGAPHQGVRGTLQLSGTAGCRCVDVLELDCHHIQPIPLPLGRKKLVELALAVNHGVAKPWQCDRTGYSFLCVLQIDACLGLWHRLVCRPFTQRR